MCSEESNYSRTFEQNHTIYDGNNVIKYGKQYADLIIMTSNNDVKEYLVSEINRHDKTIYIDGEDTSPYKKDPSAFPLYFKREMLLSLKHSDNVRPFPFAAEKRYFYPKYLPEYYVSCLFGPHDSTKPDRVWIENKLKSMSDPRNYIGQKYGNVKHTIDTGGREHLNYYDIISKSRISVDSYGAFQCNAARFWEILACKTCLLTQPILIHMPYPFEKNEHYIEFKNENELEEKINFLEKDSYYETREIATRGHEYLKEYHTTKKRAEYLLKECKDKGIING